MSEALAVREMKAEQETTKGQDAARVMLGAMLMAVGASHLTFARNEFKAQVPTWVPVDPDTVVLDSGFIEIALGAGLVFLPRQKKLLGQIAGLFFTTIFPGNLEQFAHRRDAFGLNSDEKRFARLFLQPALVALALWSTGAGKKETAKKG